MMDSPLPIQGRILVHRQGKRLGPYDVDELLELLEEGKLSYEDRGQREGSDTTESLRELLDWDLDQVPETTEEGSKLPPRHGGRERARRREVLCYSGHPSWVTFPWTVLIMCGGVATGVALRSVDDWLMLVSFGLAIAALARLALIRAMSDFEITTRRIEVTQGLLARSTKEIRIEDIRAINVTCRGLKGILGIGTVEFYTSGDEPEVRFRDIWAAAKVRELVRRIQDTV